MGPSQLEPKHGKKATGMRPIEIGSIGFLLLGCTADIGV